MPGLDPGIHAEDLLVDSAIAIRAETNRGTAGQNPGKDD